MSKQYWMKPVRGAISKAKEPFTTRDIFIALGIQDACTAQDSVRSAINRLEVAAELRAELVEPEDGASHRRSYYEYHRTSTFREAEFNPQAQKIAAEFLQALAIAWANRRRLEVSA